MRIFVTGGTGFVGKALIENLVSQHYEVRALVRQPSKVLPMDVEQVILDDLADLTVHNSCGLSKNNFKDVEVLVHTAALVHVMNNSLGTFAKFREVNRDATLVLARLAAESGIKRFIFLSSIKVNGEMTKPNNPFTPDDEYIPDEPYGLSKYEAEKGLLALAKHSNMEVVIIRPPLVYGPEVKGNFSSLMKWMRKPVPLPFGAVHNQRSLIALDNLVSFISLCIDREKSMKASSQVFLVSDGQDISTTLLLKKVRQALNLQSPGDSKAWLIPIPVYLLKFFAKLFGKGDIAVRLLGSLQVDSSKTYDLLGWTPEVTIDEQLAKMPKETLKR